MLISDNSRVRKNYFLNKYSILILMPCLLQFYSVAVIGYRVATFNDCLAAAEELQAVSTVPLINYFISLLSHLWSIGIRHILLPFSQEKTTCVMSWLVSWLSKFSLKGFHP